MPRDADVAMSKEIASHAVVACGNSDPTPILRSAIARHRSVFASSSLAPLAMTRFNASASGSQSGVYATDHHLHRPHKRLARGKPDGGGDCPATGCRPGPAPL